MSAPTPKAQLPDALEREQAATTFDRNVVVTAGAGTGKTRLLVDRLIHLLMRDPETRLTRVVALTFTNKAANEMKTRLRERLGSYLEMRLEAAPATPQEEAVRGEIRSLMERYRLTKEGLNRRALEALRQIERSEIGTIHGFAATLLRLYPMEGGVDPQFIEDEGGRFDRIFSELWEVWLDQELSDRGPRREDWKRVLRKIELDELQALARSLCSESVDLERLGALAREAKTPALISSWLGSLAEKGSALLRRHPEDRANERLVRTACEIIETFLRTDNPTGSETPDTRRKSLSGSLNRHLKGWSEEDCAEAQEIARVARALCQVDDALARDAGDLLIPFASHFREAFAAEGAVSFDGLLARARTLVRDYPAVREELKRRFQAILIDEFQDTDPIQYEILIYLAEELGRQARSWKEVRLTPGKIFVVGDPKQSIYAFRRADIEAYLEVVEKIIKAQNGIESRLLANFRSHGKILDVVNGLFDRLIRPQPGLQPEYVAIQPAPLNGGAEGTDPLPFRKVSIRIVRGESDRPDMEFARRLEAENLARWLDEEVLGRERIIDEHGGTRAVQPRDIAILLRKLTDVHHYLEPLRRRGLRYVVEGERHFYAVQEVIDAVNLLRAVDNPHDRLALTAVLRSPLGGLTDAEIYKLHSLRLLDYRVMRRIHEKKPFRHIQELYMLMASLHREIQSLPVGEAIAKVFERLPVRLLAARSFHGEQAVANLEKLRRQAELIGSEGLSTFREVVTRLGARVLDIKDEAESALAEENLEAIRILSIHKSKGLEFPVVVLAGCHAAANRSGEREPAVLQDWSTDLAGLRTRAAWSLIGLYIAEKERRREEEEQKRILYVAMTRAREHLTLSCAPTGRKARGSILALTEEALGSEITADGGSRLILAGRGRIEIQTVRESLGPPGKAPRAVQDDPAPTDWNPYARLWRERAQARDAALKTELFLTPTLLKRRETEMAESFFERRRPPTSPDLSLLTGEMAHRFLEEWNFADDTAGLRAKLGPFLDRWTDAGANENRDRLQADLEEIFDTFFSSEAYRDLSASRILGREVPLLMPWDGRVMEGVVDLLYERAGRLYLADYKTDRVAPEDLTDAAAAYHHQIRIYSEAARRSLNRDVAGFNLIFLRLGQAVELPPK